MPNPYAVGRDLKTYSCFDLSGGLDVKTSPTTLALLKKQNRLSVANHVQYASEGGVSKRGDVTTFTSSSLGASVGITGGFQLRRSNGNDYNLIGTDDGRVLLLNTDGTTTGLVSGLTTARRWSFSAYNDKAIYCNGADVPRYYDGTTEAILPGTPPATAQIVASHGNRVFMVTVTSSTISWCALNDETDWTTATNAGSMVIARNDSSIITALVPSINELVAIKRNRPYRIQGTNPTTFLVSNVVPTVGSVGAESFSAALFALNDVLYLSQAGVNALSQTQDFGDLKERFISERIEPYFTPGSDHAVSLNRLNLAVMAYDRDHNRIYVGVDTDNDSENDTILVYDPLLKAWSVWADIPCASMWLVRNATTGASDVYVGGYDGHVRVLEQNTGAETFTASFKHVSALNDIGWEKSPRHVFIYAKEEGNWNLTAVTDFDFGASGGQTYTVSLLGGSKTLGVNWTLGTDPLGARSQIVRRFNASGTGEFIGLTFSNGSAGQPFTVYGYQAMYRRRRQIRRAA